MRNRGFSGAVPFTRTEPDADPVGVERVFGWHPQHVSTQGVRGGYAGASADSRLRAPDATAGGGTPRERFTRCNRRQQRALQMQGGPIRSDTKEEPGPHLRKNAFSSEIVITATGTAHSTNREGPVPGLLFFHSAICGGAGTAGFVSAFLDRERRNEVSRKPGAASAKGGAARAHRRWPASRRSLASAAAAAARRGGPSPAASAVLRVPPSGSASRGSVRASSGLIVRTTGESCSNRAGVFEPERSRCVLGRSGATVVGRVGRGVARRGRCPDDCKSARPAPSGPTSTL